MGPIGRYTGGTHTGEVNGAVVVGVNLVDHVLQLRLGGVLAQRAHDSTQLLGGDLAYWSYVSVYLFLWIVYRRSPVVPATSCQDRSHSPSPSLSCCRKIPRQSCVLGIVFNCSHSQTGRKPPCTRRLALRSENRPKGERWRGQHVFRFALSDCPALRGVLPRLAISGTI